jgi:hypothetical protein
VNFIDSIVEDYNQIIQSFRNLRLACAQLQNSLRRDWPPVFQNLKKIEGRMNNIEEDIKESRTKIWKKSELMKNYYSIKSQLRYLLVLLNEIKDADEKDVQEFVDLEERYKKLVIEYSNRLFEGDPKNIQKVTETGNEHLKFLRDAYHYGVPENNGPSRKWTPAEIKERLRSHIQDIKQQIVNFNRVRVEKISVEQEMK